MVPSPTVKFELNGESFESNGPISVLSLLERLDLANKRVAVAINDDVIPKSRFGEVRIEDGDRVEVIQAVGGG